VNGYRPAASWVMGRSARWHSPEGRALLAEVAAEEELQQARIRLSLRLARFLVEQRDLGAALSLAAALVALVRAHVRAHRQH
jgi:hypothetical protein